MDKVLPPNPNKTNKSTFGMLFLRMKKFHLNSKVPQVKDATIRVKFFGEVGNGTMLKPVDS